jgi:hypothetical protein
MEGKASIEVSIDELPPIDTATEATVSAIVYLNRYSGVNAGLIPLPERTATERMSKELYSAGEIRTKHEKVLEKLANIPTFELQYCELDRAIEKLALLTNSL